MEALRILRYQSPDYQRYLQLLKSVQSSKKLKKKGKLGELASYNYYINKDLLKELKNKLKEQGLL